MVFLVSTLFAQRGNLPAVHAANIWYVNGNIHSPGNGTSWALSFKDLQPAINATRAGDTIQDAQGFYLPTTARLATDARTKSFILKDNIQILASYLAGTQTRDPRRYPTILSGDLDQNDENRDGNNINETWESVIGNNAYSVVFGENLSAMTVLDGFIITGGFADNTDVEDYKHGGGVHIKGGAPVFKNLAVSGNKTLYFRHHGGSMWFDASAARVEDSVISGNFGFGSGGSGIYTDSNVTIKNTIIRNNFSRLAGGGIFLWFASLSLENVKVIANTGRVTGG